MTSKQSIKAVLTELILSGSDDIDTIAERFSAAFPNEDAEVLGEIWVEVMEELPELN